ncbi:MAG: thioredoxin family protein [Phycisphaerae bacterium]|nr:thioredoxin family protein [Phycisphaerae bacterium]
MRNVFFFCVAVLLTAGPVAAQFSDAPTTAKDVLTLRAIPRNISVIPGETFYVAMEIRIADGWVYYSPVPGEEAQKVGIPPAQIDVQTDSMRVGEIRWPMDFLKPGDVGFPAVWSYKKKAVIYVSLSVPADAAAGERTITLQPRGQICGAGGCVNIQGLIGDANFAATTKIAVGNESKRSPAWEEDQSLEEGLANAKTVEQLRELHKKVTTVESQAESGIEEKDSSRGFFVAVGIALLAGLALNIMPCVLPVIPIRILSIVELAGRSRRRFVTMGLAFAAGMMLFFVGIAAINVVLKLVWSVGFDINEGFQYPIVVVTLAMIVVAMAANLFGVFNVIVPSKVAGLETNVQSHAAGHVKSVFMGFMMAVLATPCSFAFLATALAYAQTATLLKGTVVILAIGLGMSVPHAVLAAFPSLVNRLPKPGRWMELFKQSSGFVLLLVAVWLFSGLRDGGSSYPYWKIAWAVVFVFCLWMWSSWVRYDAPMRKKLLVRGIAVVLAFGSGLWMLRPPSQPLIEPVKFSVAEIDEARAEGKTVLVKFTANLCLKCKQQDYYVYNTPKVADAIRRLGVVYMKGDVSRADQPAAIWMHEHGYGSGIPMTIIFPPKGEPYPPMRSELTIDMLIEALQKATENER